jgi:hypothetical protein
MLKHTVRIYFCSESLKHKWVAPVAPLHFLLSKTKIPINLKFFLQTRPVTCNFPLVPVFVIYFFPDYMTNLLITISKFNYVGPIASCYNLTKEGLQNINALKMNGLLKQSTQQYEFPLKHKNPYLPWK